MSMVKVTAKIPLGLLEVLKAESKRTGVGVQNLAGQLLTHAYYVIREEQAKAKEQKDESLHSETKGG